MKSQHVIFKNFPEFWYYTKNLSEEQRDVIFHSLPEEQQTKLQRSYKVGGWEDLFIRNNVDEIVNHIKEDTEVDMIYVRCRVMMGRSYYMKKSLWTYIIDTFGDFPEEHISHILGGITYKSVNKQTVLLLKNSKSI